jgi:hypothetical protein
MRRFLSVLVLLASSAALDVAFAKGGVLHLFVRTRPWLLSCHRQVNF